MPNQVLLHACGITHTGRVRARNEDALILANDLHQGDLGAPVVLRARVPDSSLLLVAVADGMGGHAGGSVASRTALEFLRSRLETLSTPAGVHAALQGAHEELVQLGNAQPALAGLGTTIAGIVITNETLITFNVGDSRIYRVQGAYLRQVSIDDVRETPGGVFDPMQPATTHALTQALGGSSIPSALHPHVSTQPLRWNDRYLLCSDGLTNALSPDDLEQNIAAPIRTWVEELLHEAIPRATDNVTVVAVEVLMGENDTQERTPHDQQGDEGLGEHDTTSTPKEAEA